jgi:hypothetical protein
MRRPMLVVGSAALVLVTADAGAQSLGDIARKEAERRGTAPPAAQTYTNETLTPDFTTPALPPAAPQAVLETETVTAAAELTEEQAAKQQEQDPEKWGVTPLDQQAPAPADDHNEEFWRTRATLLKGRIAGQNTQIEQLRERMTATRGSDDAERDVLERTFRKAEMGLKSLNDEWVRFERQARDRKVPEHWWR